MTWGWEVVGCGVAWKRKEMQRCPGNQELGANTYVCLSNSLSQHGDLVLDAALFPLQSLFRDALHRKHPACQPLLGKDHLRKCSSENTRTRMPHESQAHHSLENVIFCLLVSCWFIH